jgi:NAD(P)-dependent dehydrogenase (short-subunit alcohol dehydrogenase family)
LTKELAQHALVIGASGGIGRCVAELLCVRGMNVIGIDLKESSLSCPNYSHVQLDMSLSESVDEVINSARGRPVSYVINVAGGAEPRELDRTITTDFALESLEGTLSSNFKTSIAGIMIARRLASEAAHSDISVTLCSSINTVGNYQYPIYSAFKNAVESLVLSQAVPLGRQGIRINAIRLGTVVTEASLHLHSKAGSKHYEPLLRLASLARFVTIREAAVAFVSVAVDITGMTGEVITVDAGQSVPGHRT